MLLDFSKKAFDVIVQAGQSNAEGFGFGNIENAYQPSDKVWYLNGDFTISQAAEKATNNAVQANFSLPFAQCYLEHGLLSEGRNLLILRCAEGGTGFCDHRWGPNDDLYLRMLEMIHTALDLNPANRLVAFLWHQGEIDGAAQASFETHRNNVQTLIDGVRTTFLVPDLPFLAADFVPQWFEVKRDNLTPITAAIRAVCDTHPKSRFIETHGLRSNSQDLTIPHPLLTPAQFAEYGDYGHFSRKSTYELGKRYFNAFLTCLDPE